MALSYERRHADILGHHTRPSGGANDTMFNLFLNYTTSTTVANSVTETSLLGAPDLGTTKTVTPGLAGVGRTFELFFYGVLGWTAAPALTIRLKLGGALGTLLQAYTPALPGSSSGTAWRLSLFATITAIGAGGSIQGNPGMFEFNSVGADGPAQWSGRNTTAAAVNFSVGQDWALTAQWGTADLLNFFTYGFGCINVIR